MDSERVESLRKYDNIQYRGTVPETNRTINRVNPFDTVGNYHERRVREKLQKRTNGEIINIYDHTVTTPRDASVTSLNARRELIEDVFSNQPYSREPTPSYKRSDRSLSQPTFNLPTKYANNSHATTQNTPKSYSYKYSNHINYEQNNKNDTFARRSTKQCIIDVNIPPPKLPCEPQQNIYNEELVLKTMQRHARLQKIVRKLVIERHKEKQREAWNNYINELKNKHKYYSNEPSRISPQYVPNEEVTDDFWNTSNSYVNNDHCPSVLNSIYRGARNDYQDKYLTIPSSQPRQYYESNPYCYPTASQGRLMMLNRERQRLNSMPRQMNKYKSLEVDPDIYRGRYDCNKIRCNKTFPNVKPNSKYLNTPAIITEDRHGECSKVDTFKRLFNKQVSKLATLKEQILQTDKEKELPYESIEQKLDVLIKSVNSVIVEIKGQKEKATKNVITTSRSISCMLQDFSSLVLNKTKSESYAFQNDNDILYTTHVLQDNNRNVVLSEIGTSTPKLGEVKENKIAEIIEEEMEKSVKIRKDIEELLHTKCNQQCSVELEFDIPTREVSTFAANPFPQAQYFVEPETKINTCIRTQDQGSNRLITIAVNTDPLGLCALLQISADTVKQLLSYMLNLTADTHLMPVRHRRQPCDCDFICNICGETFSKASQLSDHIERHYFGRKRNCCVCRHVLNTRNDRIGLFNCKYCGQKFTRAYCCEIHQQACAKLYGKKHDVQSNLMILR